MSRKKVSEFDKMFKLEHLEARMDVTPLHLAAVRGELEFVMKNLKKNPIEMGVRTKDGNDLLMLAAANDQAEVVAFLIEFKANLYHRNNMKKNVLDYVAREGIIGKPIPQMILKNMDFIATEIFDSPLALMCTKVLQKLQRENVAIVPITFLGPTPDFTDVFEGDDQQRQDWMRNFKAAVRTVKKGCLLLDDSVAYLESDAALGGALEVPMSRRYVYIPKKNDIVKYANALDVVYGRALEKRLIDAASQGDVQAIRGLLKAGGHPNVDDEKGQTLLMKASFCGATETMTAILDAKAHVNVQNVDGYSALLVAAARGHANAIKLLLEYGADAHVKSYKGNSAMDFAKHEGREPVKEALLSAHKKHGHKKFEPPARSSVQPR
eukprot:gnl/MRDRNA2_/MRDRNA2_33801_c0_seq1.p1 gnl/MRDRNA2_/MRDRNA2_33801_c0~~gnl/MRDRNA2_/MRDRNA2_33801_c0_seq1.p1  ORF type:complete len:380 (-),score=84.13 gnl/MRDRNA2_/MRDRNA2_33801_c0_seq1:9-1148(-)